MHIQHDINVHHDVPQCINVLFIVVPITTLVYCMLASSEIHRGLASRTGLTKDAKIGICCFYTMHAVYNIEEY